MLSAQIRACLLLSLLCFVSKVYCSGTITFIESRKPAHDHNITLVDRTCFIEPAGPLLAKYEILKTLNESKLQMWQNVSSLKIVYVPHNKLANRVPSYLGREGLSLSIKYQADAVPSISSILPRSLVNPLNKLINLFIGIIDTRRNDTVKLNRCAWIPSDTRGLAYVFCYWHKNVRVHWDIKLDTDVKNYLNQHLNNKWSLLNRYMNRSEPKKWTFMLKRKGSIWELTYSQYTLLLPNKMYFIPYGSDVKPIVSIEKNAWIREEKVDVSRSVGKAGMHRLLYTNFSWSSGKVDWWKNHQECRMLSIETLPEDFFISEFEIEELRKFNGDQIQIFREIDIEIMSEMATQNVVVVSNKISGRDTHNMSLIMPLHFRYHQPTWGEKKKAVILEPVTATICGPARITSDKTLDILMAADYENWMDGDSILYLHRTEGTRSHQKSKKDYPKVLEIDCPVGNYKEKWKVKYVTRIVSMLGAMVVIIFALKKKHNSERRRLT